jgi:hypothetical protein
MSCPSAGFAKHPAGDFRSYELDQQNIPLQKGAAAPELALKNDRARRPYRTREADS